MFGLNREKLQMVLPSRLSWLQGAVLWLVILSFVFFGIVAWGMGSGGPGSSGAGEDESLLAEVDGHHVTRQAFLRRLRETDADYRERFGEQADAFLRSMNVPQQVLNSLINREVALREARQAGLKVSPGEVRDYIVSTFVDEQGHFYGREVMRRIAAQRQYTEGEFRQRIADDLLVNKLQDLVAASAIITDAEVRTEYLRRNDRAKIEYVYLDPGRLAEQETATEAELRALYDEDSQRFAVEERSARYVAFAASEFGASTDPSDEDVQAVWEREGASRFPGQSQEQASSLIRDEMKADAARRAAREHAAEILTRFRESGDIAALATESKHPVYETGFFSQSNPPAVLDGLQGDTTGLARTLFTVTEMGKLAAFPTPVGDASVLVQWLDKRGPIVPAFEVARDAVLQAWRKDRGGILARDIASKLRSALAGGSNLATAATAAGTEAKPSSPFSRTGPVPGIPDSAALAQLAYQVPLGTPQETQVSGGPFFFIVAERFEMDETKFSGERDAVRNTLVQRRQNEVWEEFLAAQRRELETHSKVRVTPLAAELVPDNPGDARF